MSEQYARPVFMALDGGTYDTKEDARLASKEHLIRARMCERLNLSYEGRVRSARQESLKWFIENRDRILTAYYASESDAELELQEGE